MSHERKRPVERILPPPLRPDRPVPGPVVALRTTLRTTWFKVEQDWLRDLVKYLRGDIQSGGKIRSTRDAIDSYIHTYYEDLEDRYRGEVFKFRI